MKVTDGQSTLELVRDKGQFKYYFTGTQVNRDALTIIQSKLAFGKSSDEAFAFEALYKVPQNAKTLTQLIQGTQSMIERLDLSLRLSSLMLDSSNYQLAFVHPENIVEQDGKLSFVHFGLAGSLTPQNLNADSLLALYKALVFATLNPKRPFDDLVGAESAGKDKLSQAISQAEDRSSVQSMLEAALKAEKSKTEAKLIKVSRGRYAFFKYAGVTGLLAAAVLTYFTYVDRTQKIPKAEAINQAQANFIVNRYDKTLEDLKDYQPENLPKYARYVMATSSVNLANLNQNQKTAILNNLSSATGDNTLNYWIYQGRGEFEKALDLAKNIGDVQLTLLAYTDLYEATKLDNKMAGTEKEKRLADYEKQIQELTKALGK